MSEDGPPDWNSINDAMPRDGTLLRLLCHGRAPDYKPFICKGRFTDSGWASYEGDKLTGLIEPLGWQFIH